MSSNPSIINGGVFKDERGQLEFYNDFDLSPIRRVYFTTHFNTNIIRAWQGHKIEKRWFLCTKGSFLIKLIKVDDWENPSKTLKNKEYILSDKSQQILSIPNGYVNGFKALEEDSKLMIMSDYLMGELDKDQIRFDQNTWASW